MVADFGVMFKHPVSGEDSTGYGVCNNELLIDPAAEPSAWAKASHPVAAPSWLVHATADKVGV